MDPSAISLPSEGPVHTNNSNGSKPPLPTNSSDSSRGGSLFGSFTKNLSTKWGLTGSKPSVVHGEYGTNNPYNKNQRMGMGAHNGNVMVSESGISMSHRSTGKVNMYNDISDSSINNPVPMRSAHKYNSSYN